MFEEIRRVGRRAFLKLSGAAALGLATATTRAAPDEAPEPGKGLRRETDPLPLFLAGDVMTGRGVDQVLPNPVDPELHESYVRSALDYVALAERASGRIERPVPFAYPWGDSLRELERVRPAARIVNLETSVTASPDTWPKGINYRMHPENVACLTAAGLDGCVLANNHVLDWGEPGLLETLDTLRAAGVKTAGAGRDLEEARRPAVLELAGGGRVLVFAFGSRTSGIPRSWAAADDRPGVDLLEDLSDGTVDRIAARVRAWKRPGDVVVASVHWGANWGYRIPGEQKNFARGLVDRAAVDVVHGHSSHHPKGIEVHAGRPILYGCGDFLNDYEGIGGHEEYRGELTLMYFPALDRADGRLLRLEIVPMRIRRFRLERAAEEDARWLRDMLNREGRKLGTAVRSEGDGLTLTWS